MQRAISTFLWLIVASIAAFTLYYFATHTNSATFVESSMGNLFATIVGVLVGVPVALEISRRQQVAQAAAVQADKEREQAVRKRKVLTLLRREIEDNLGGIHQRRLPIERGEKREVWTQSLKTQLWTAFSDGGELNHVNNPELLAILADAYECIRHCVMLESKVLEAAHWQGMRTRQEKYPVDYFLEYLDNSDPKLLNAMSAALKAIDAELAQ